MDEDIFFSNFSYDPHTYYFLYIGELKSSALIVFLQDVLQRRMQCPVEGIAIVPDILDQYNYRNVIALSPMLTETSRTNGERVSFRTDPARFFAMVSRHSHVLSLVDRILSRQEQLYLYMYESDPHMTLDQRDRVILIGPDKDLAHRLNNKAVQFQLLERAVPVVDFRICSSFQEMLQTAESLWDTWEDGIFVSRMYSAAGTASTIAQSVNDILACFTEDDSGFLLSRYIPHEFDPTVLGVVANDEEVYIAGVADQRIEDGNRFVGSTYPSILPDDIIAALEHHTRTIGRIIGRLGYRGIFGCDFLVDRENQIRFLEINARKQGTTLEFCYTLEQMLPPESPMLPELEFYAVTQNRFPNRTREIDLHPGICWGTYNYKARRRCCSRGYIPQNPHEREAFAKVARGELLKDFVILEHIGAGQVILPGTFVARAVSVATNREDVELGLQQAREFIELTIHH